MIVNFNIADVSLPLCPEQYRYQEGLCYKMVNILLGFFYANAECNKQPGGHLATFSSTDKYKFLLNLKG